jgi:4-hydroxymandelate synthase
MTMPSSRPFDDVQVDHIEYTVGDLPAATGWLVDGYGFSVFAAPESPTTTRPVRSAGLRQGRIELVLTEPAVDDHPATAYLERHGDGVSDIALRVPDAAAAFAQAVRRGARPTSSPVRRGTTVTASVIAFGDVTHTFVQRDQPGDRLPWLGGTPGVAGTGTGLHGVDHFAVCLEPGQLDPTVDFYTAVLDFDMIFTERIVVGTQAMNSKVVQSRSAAVTLTLIEPDTSREPGQIDGFLKNHGGAGVQHVAFVTDDIVSSVGTISGRGIEFLRTPATYYQLLAERVELTRHTGDALRALNVLVDEDPGGQLFQIFARSTHERDTFFVEVIERFGARTFGSSNIKSLYEAVELQRAQGHDA